MEYIVIIAYAYFSTQCIICSVYSLSTCADIFELIIVLPVQRRTSKLHYKSTHVCVNQWLLIMRFNPLPPNRCSRR